MSGGGGGGGGGGVMPYQPQYYGGGYTGGWSEQPPPYVEEPPGSATPPGSSAPGSTPASGTPPAGSPAPAGSSAPAGGPYGGQFQPGGPPYGSGRINIQRPGNWLSVPFLQTYGGQPAPFSDLTAQILNAMQMQNSGTGRFQSNAASRYSFQGGRQQRRPDANPWGEPILPYAWQPQWNPPRANPPPTSGVPSAPPPSAGTPPGGGGGAAPSPGSGGATPPPGSGGGAVDHAANFRRLLAEDPRLAQEYRVRSGDTINWWQRNGLSMFDGDQEKMNAFANQNSPQSSNAAPLTMEEMRRLNQMAGIRSPF